MFVAAVYLSWNEITARTIPTFAPYRANTVIYTPIFRKGLMTLIDRTLSS